VGPVSMGVDGRVRVAAERMFAALQAPSAQGGCLGMTWIARRFGACGKRAGDASITTDGGIGSFDDTAATHHH
jgi:hypothetical protein